MRKCCDDQTNQEITVQSQHRVDTGPRPVRLAYVTTVPLSLVLPSGFIRGKVDYLRARGMEIHAVSSPGAELDAFGSTEKVPIHPVEMPRRITPFHDAVALCRLVALMRRIRPSVVHANTPKGGLLGMMAAWFTRIPVRIYQMHGLPFMTATGLKRWMLLVTEKVSCALAHRVFCVSPSLRDVALAEGICSREKLVVLGKYGSGVDAEVRFNPTRVGRESRDRVRMAVGIPPDSMVIGFVGRIVKDKGIVELAEAWESFAPTFAHSTSYLSAPLNPKIRFPSTYIDIFMYGHMFT